jgi:hypothetical protein
MGENRHAGLWMRRTRLLNKLDRLVDSGRLTSAEAARLRAASNADEFDAVAREISVRHARGDLDKAVAAGEITEDEADRRLEAVQKGEHRRSLRGHVRRGRIQPNS